MNWVGYGFTEGLKIGRVVRDISVRGKAGEPRGKKYPLKIVKGGDNSSSREGVEVTQGRGTVPLTNLTYIYLDSYC